jgi:hypothetical protein
MISTPLLAAVAKPTLTPPAPETDRLPSVPTAEDDADVVFPSAARLLAVPEAAVVAPEKIRVLDEIPTVTPPAPEKESASGSADDVEDELVVFPTAKRLREPWLAAVVAPDMTSAPAPAAVVEKPTETPPAPLIDMLLSVCVVDEVAAVVFPMANSFCTTPEAAGLGTETIRILFDEYPTLAIPAPETLTERASKVVDELDPVVFPTAKPPKVWTLWLVVAEII